MSAYPSVEQIKSFRSPVAGQSCQATKEILGWWEVRRRRGTRHIPTSDNVSAPHTVHRAPRPLSRRRRVSPVRRRRGAPLPPPALPLVCTAVKVELVKTFPLPSGHPYPPSTAAPARHAPAQVPRRRCCCCRRTTVGIRAGTRGQHIEKQCVPRSAGHPGARHGYPRQRRRRGGEGRRQAAGGCREETSQPFGCRFQQAGPDAASPLHVICQPSKPSQHSTAVVVPRKPL